MYKIYFNNMTYVLQGREILFVWSVMKYLFLTCASALSFCGVCAGDSGDSSAVNSSSCYQQGLPTSAQCM